MTEQPTSPEEKEPRESCRHGIEILLIEASVDPEFRKLLLEKRAEAAKKLGLDLWPAEVAMLNGIPEAQLELAIRQTQVSKKLRAQRRRKAAGVALAALGVGAMKLGCDKWIQYERDKQASKYFTIVTIAGAIRTVFTPPPPPRPKPRIFPDLGVQDATEWDAAGKGERQAKDLSSDGE